MKRPPFSDVATMLVSFHDAVHSGLRGKVPGIIHREDDSAPSILWADFWYRWVAAAFLRGYRAAVGTAPLLPGAEKELEILLNVLTLDRFLAEAERYAVQNREALIVPLAGIVRVIEDWPLAG
jgi:maltose alpha-D-glucosyltransferase/alpha-amylase